MSETCLRSCLLRHLAAAVLMQLRTVLSILLANNLKCCCHPGISAVSAGFGLSTVPGGRNRFSLATSFAFLVNSVLWVLHAGISILKSHTGYCVRVDRTNSASVLNRSVKQKSLAESSMEAEIIALHEGVRHLLWVLDVYVDLGFHPTCAVEVYQDNQAAIQLSKDVPVNFKGNSKFISRRFFSVHEHLDSGRIQLVYAGTDDMLADYFSEESARSSRYKSWAWTRPERKRLECRMCICRWVFYPDCV